MAPTALFLLQPHSAQRSHTRSNSRSTLPRWRTLASWGLTSLIASLLAGCGGGSGSSSSGSSILTSSRCTTSTAVATTGTDPLLSSQWHLSNTRLWGAPIGYDTGAFTLWDQGYQGQGVGVAVVDSAVQIGHPDLVQNADYSLSYNYLTRGNDPAPGYTVVAADDAGGCNDAHGTAVAGLVAARDGNGLGGAGVAPRAKLVGLNPLATADSSGGYDHDIADALVRLQNRGVAILVNSWGAPDDNGGYQKAASIYESALEQGVTEGRVVQGVAKGLVYFFPAGNAAIAENSNFDGYVNRRQVLTIGAVDAYGLVPSYSEQGANVLIAGYSGSTTRNYLTSTDLTGRDGFNNLTLGDYTYDFSGTSGATPTVAGVAALMLQANPQLSWRDVRWLLAKTARKVLAIDFATEPSALNANGYSHRAGFGVVDGIAAVTAAKAPGWTSLPTQKTCSSTVTSVNASSTLYQPYTKTSQITLPSSCGITTIESVEVQFSAQHNYSGDYAITLDAPTSAPAIRRSTLATFATCATTLDCEYFKPGANWTYHSIRHLGEPWVAGPWTLTVNDRARNGSGTWQSWKLTVYGH